MGNLTLQNFRDELIFDLRNRTDRTATEGVTDTRLDMWITAGYYHVTHPSVFKHRELQHAYTIPLVSGTQAYTFTPTSGGATIHGLRYVSHVAAATDSPTAQRTKLLPRDEQWFQTRTLTSGGTPRNFCVRAAQILLDPVPGANEAGEVLAIGAWRQPTALTAAGQATEIPALFDEIVLLASRWRAELHLGYRDLAEATKIDFVSLLNEYQDFQQLHGEDWDWTSEVRTEAYMESA